MYGLCRESLLLMDVPKTPDLRMKNDNGKVGHVCITRGEMSLSQFVQEFNWLVPGDHQWEIYHSGKNVFKVN
jgi:hypothetical protein